MQINRPKGDGWLALLGGGEFSFGDTEAADRAWLDRTPAGPVGFLPAASGSTDYGVHFAAYLEERFGRTVETIPVFRPRDARRTRNAERIAESAAVYLGGGVPDPFLDALRDSLCAEALLDRLRAGGTVVAMAAAAQSLGQVARSLFGGGPIPGLAWLVNGVIEPNFDPEHDRRLRQLLQLSEVRWGLGLPAGSALLLGPAGEVVVIGSVFTLAGAEEDFEVLEERPAS